MPKILIVDDDENWCGDLEKNLHGFNFDIEICNKRASAMKLIIQEEFDLVIANVWLDNGNEEIEIREQWKELLKEIVNQGSEIIVITARSSYSEIDVILRQAYKNFEVSDFLIKEDFDENEFYEAVRVAIIEHYSKPKYINGREYELRGVNRQIYSFLARNNVLPNLLKGIYEYDSRLFRALGSNQYDESLGESKKLLLDIWNMEVGLPPYLFIDTLSEFEFNRTYFKGYRDHITHQLRVYLLGLYIYHGVDYIKDSIKQEFIEFPNPEEAFLRSWRIASIFHDIGYVFEVGKEKADNAYSEVITIFNEFFEFPLCHHCDSKGISLLESQELKAQELFSFPRHRVKSLKNLELYREKKILKEIEGLIKPTQLSSKPDGLFRYYKYTQKTTPPYSARNEPFVDHGIASAIILLHLHQFFDEYTLLFSKAVEDNKDELSDILIPGITELLEKTVMGINNIKEILRHAAAAIALHNIQVDIWDYEDAWTDSLLTLNAYKISLAQNPLAFLLCLVDALQDWDRPLFSEPSPNRSYVSQDQDILIEFSKGQIQLNFINDELKGTSKSSYTDIVEELTKYLEADDISLLLIEHNEKK